MRSSLARSGQQFQKRFLLLINTVSTATPALVLLYLIELLELTPEELTGFLQLLAAAVVLSIPVGTPSLTRATRPLRRYLDARAQGTPDRDTLEAAFRCAVNLPAIQFVLASLLLLAPSAFILVGMVLRFEGFGAWESTVLATAILSLAPLSALIQAFVVKQWLRPLRAQLAADLPDPETHARLTHRIPIRRKLQLVIVTTASAPVLFTALFAYQTSHASIEEHVERQQQQMLSSIRRSWDAGNPEWLEQKRRAVVDLGIDFRLMLVDPSGRDAAGLAGLLPRERAWMIESGAERGSGAGLQSQHVFQWSRLPDGRMLVLAKPRAELPSLSASSAGTLCIVVLLCFAFALLLAFFTARDIGEATEMMGTEARLIAAGDLRASQPFTSEDELGELGRAFAAMRLSLNTTVRHVIEAADQVEAQSRGIAEAMDDVTHGTEREARGLRESSSSMGAFNQQLDELSGACQGLGEIVEEASSSILELSAAGQQLSDNAGILRSKVDASASAAEQMGQSVQSVGQSGDALRSAAEDTSSSMEEMAASLQEVNRTVDESAKLSKRVVDAASEGFERVRETIEGMATIRSATQSAQDVVRGLGERTGEIGSILDVIDSVADETSLLALNAAIIAAQAGEHGRGFAVVADEIKELADRVLESTREIGAVIGAVQSETANAVAAIDEGAESVSRGVVLAEQAGRSLEDINEATRDSGHRMELILSAVDEQAEAARHVLSLMGVVREGVEHIHRATGEHQGGSAVLMQTTSEMSEIAQQLHATAREHAAGAGRISGNVEGVRDRTSDIQRSVAAQGESGSQMSTFLEAGQRTTEETLASVAGAVEAATSLEAQARALREAVARFRT